MKREQNTKYNAIWLSHSSVGDFLKCHRLYFLKNVWKNEQGNKINTVSPYLSLGLSVHQTIEPLAALTVQERLHHVTLPKLLESFEKNWAKYVGKQGGFEDSETENFFKERGIEMIKNVAENPGPLLKKTVKYYKGDFIPNFYLSEKDNIILCGLVDWVEYLENTDTLRVIDFKTGKNDEKEESFQLPIYKLLVENCQKRKVTSAAYWYLDREKFPNSVDLVEEDVEVVKEKLLNIGLEIKKLKSGKSIEENFKCKYEGGCFACREFELIRDLENHRDEVEFVGTSSTRQDLYFIKKTKKMLYSNS
jgi:ATP-dependent helicase/DNAse subunit B